MKLKQILILQNKIDLVKESQAKEQYEEITKFVQGTVAEGAPIIPISAQLKYNIDVSLNSFFLYYSAVGQWFLYFLFFQNLNRYCASIL